jgi:monovalent cation:H+ antiporter, CPA1 family
VVILAAIVARAVILFGLLPLLTRCASRPGRTALPGRDPLGRAAGRGHAGAGAGRDRELPRAARDQARGRHPRHGLHAVHADRAGHDAALGDRRLGLDRLSPIDEALSRQVVAVALQTVREDVARTTENYELTRDIVRSEAKRFGERLDEAVRAAEDSADILDRDRITLGLIALAGPSATRSSPACANARSRPGWPNRCCRTPTG